MVMFAIFLGCINGGFDNTVSHTNAYNGQCIPEPAHKNRMPHVPDPFKIKRKHLLSSCPLVPYVAGGPDRFMLQPVLIPVPAPLTLQLPLLLPIGVRWDSAPPHWEIPVDTDRKWR
jgi:hypothetical protein